MANVLIYTYSSTGNTTKVGEIIKEELTKEKVGKVVLRDLIVNIKAGKIDDDLNDYDIIGIGYYARYNAESPEILPYLRTIDDTVFEGKKVFVFESYGGITSNGLTRIGSEMALRGSQIIGFGSIFAPDNFPPLLNSKATHKFQWPKTEIKKAEEFGANLAKQITSGQYEKVSFKINKPKERQMPTARVRLRNYHIVDDTCIKCGKCAEVCPLNAITFEKGKIPNIDLDVCTACFRCFNHCPTNSILADYLEDKPQYTVKKATYVDNFSYVPTMVNFLANGALFELKTHRERVTKMIVIGACSVFGIWMTYNLIFK